MDLTENNKLMGKGIKQLKRMGVLGRKEVNSQTGDHVKANTDKWTEPKAGFHLKNICHIG